MKELICVICPRGCRLIVDEKLNVTGNFCFRGVAYAKAELTHPERVLTSTVEINSPFGGRLPVKTNKPIPKELMFDVMKEIKKISVNTPIKIGDVIIKNVLNTGADVVASKNILR